MSRAVVGEFETAEALMAALETARRQDRVIVDAFSPYPLPEAGRTPFVLAVNSCRKRRYCPVPTRIRFDVAE